MSIIQIILHKQVIFAAIIYALAAIVAVICFERIRALLNHSVLQWSWDHIGMPLLRSALLLVFILLASPVLFGITDAPDLALNKSGVNSLLNLVFIVTILFSLLPIIGKWDELLLPAQGIAACMMVFSWLADNYPQTDVHYWPEWNALLIILTTALFTHWLAISVSHLLGDKVDQKLNVEHAGELLSKAVLIFMQYPVIVIYSQALGKQLT